MDAKKRTEKICLNVVPPPVRIRCRHGSDGSTASRIVNEHVDGSHVTLGAACQALDRVLVSDISG
jgi:hypothetical protein